jgi:hypothetical protein
MADLPRFPNDGCPNCGRPLIPRLDFTKGVTTAYCQGGCTDRAERDALAARVAALETEAAKWKDRAKSRRGPTTPPPDLYVGRGKYDALLKRVAALEAQRDEALKALEIREGEPQWPYYPYERIREARRILSDDGGSG